MRLTLNTLLFSSDDEDDEGPHSAEDDDVDLGDSVTDGSEEDDAEEESDEASGSDEEESGVDSEEDSDSDSGPDLARGKGNIETSSDEDDDDDEVDSILRKEEEEIEHDWGELCKDAPRSSEVRCGVWWEDGLFACRKRFNKLSLCLCEGFCPTGRLQHGLGPAQSQRPAGSVELLHTEWRSCAVC